MKNFQALSIVLLLMAALCAGCFRAMKLTDHEPGPPTPPPSMNAPAASGPPPAAALGPKEELQDRCDQLARATPGVEELRLRNGVIETRQWNLIAHDSAPRWAVVRAKTDPPDGWSPKPGRSKALQFDPSLEAALASGAGHFLAYAPMQPENYDEGLKITSLNRVFGAARGTFQWKGKKYGYAMFADLPCFPLLQ